MNLTIFIFNTYFNLGVAVSPINGQIYVADSWNNRLQVFDENGTFLKSIEKIGQIDFHYLCF